MPTPSGLLKVGDRLEAEDRMNLVELEVVERLGSGADYSVRVRRVDGQPFPAGVGHGEGHRQMLITEIRYWMQQGKFRLVKPDEVRMRQVMAACFAANQDLSKDRVRRIVELAFQVAKVRLQP